MAEQTWMLTGDMHVGAKSGLTPHPNSKLQEGLLNAYIDSLVWFGEEPDVFLLNGDGWDGKDPKGGDVDIIDMQVQAEYCAELVAMAKPKTEVIITGGTEYHEAHHIQEFSRHFKSHLELLMLKQYGRKIKISMRDKLNSTINGWFKIEARHFIGGSSIPHGRATAPLKEQLWNVMNAALSASVRDEKVKYPDLLVFSHRHYFVAAENAWGTVVILPSWQALGGRYGDRLCSGHVDVGMCKLVVGDTKEDGWRRDKKLYLAAVERRTEHR